MAVRVKDIEVGKCYVTNAGQVRRVVKIETKITYESRGKKAIPKGKKWNPRTTAKAETFVNAVDREVRCDYDPDYPERKL